MALSEDSREGCKVAASHSVYMTLPAPFASRASKILSRSSSETRQPDRLKPSRISSLLREPFFCVSRSMNVLLRSSTSRATAVCAASVSTARSNFESSEKPWILLATLSFMPPSGVSGVLCLQLLELQECFVDEGVEPPPWRHGGVSHSASKACRAFNRLVCSFCSRPSSSFRAEASTSCSSRGSSRMWPRRMAAKSGIVSMCMASAAQGCSSVNKT
mmetsp:Transcript_99953/g.281054  ORF Transcript_99953/g.281054 Transcript_99953/m.281054 type:complete len:217 (+) Transcript_99953:380-1030(+)